MIRYKNNRIFDAIDYDRTEHRPVDMCTELRCVSNPKGAYSFTPTSAITLLPRVKKHLSPHKCYNPLTRGARVVSGANLKTGKQRRTHPGTN